MPALLDALFLSRADLAAHREALRRGGVVVSAEVADRAAAEAARLLDALGARDLGSEAEAWRAEGWSPDDDGG